MTILLAEVITSIERRQRWSQDENERLVAASLFAIRFTALFNYWSLADRGGYFLTHQAPPPLRIRAKQTLTICSRVSKNAKLERKLLTVDPQGIHLGRRKAIIYKYCS